MAKQLNVSLGFTADTSQAVAQLNSLKKSLESLTNNAALKTPDFKFTQGLQEASRAASQLKVQLDNATNVNTGNLDLTKFSESMRKSGMSLEKYQNQLYQLGPAGEKAFADLTSSITKAEVPLKRSSKMLGDLWTTMKNTARWQLTSSMLHGFMGAVQSAYGYAQDLNKSLNDIRIVTGASVEKMAEFATEANNAAKALSTTTTEYTKASLIFYQQGLDDSAVKERTDITIKMANAAGQSAEVISDQLTAVWNNFYDGSKSLEYYADVMTALGAATASSSDEIAGGLEKFASVGETIGLSYEYAAAALATITSNTRQSEEVVGNALKTIFARIQGLNLGQTLEDGVTLNKYSEALEKVGVSIFDSAGELKNMDTILTEMAATWDTLNKGQQTALAQTVAGVRQYTQFMALMKDWDSGDNDSMVANLQTAYDSEGSLQDQADIYAESWEAANKRVQASAETVYAAILNDDFFIDLTNGFAGLLGGVENFIDGLGGIKGVLLAIGSIVTNVFSKQIGQSISNALFSLKGFVNPKAIEREQLAQKEHANELLIQGYKDSGTTSGSQSAEVYSQLGEQQMAYIQNQERMSEEEKVINQMLMDRNRLLADEAIASGQKLEKLEKQIVLERKSLQVQASREVSKKTGKGFDGKALKPHQEQVEKLTKSYSSLNAVANTVEVIKGDLPDEEFKKLKVNIDDVIKSLAGVDNLNTDEDFEKLAQALGTTAEDAKRMYNALSNTENLKGLRNVLTELENTSLTSSENAIKNLKQALVEAGIDADKADAMMEDYLATIQQFGPDSVQAVEALNKLKSGVTSLSAEMNKAKTQPMELTQAFSKAASAVMGIGQAFSTVKGIMDVFNDSEATTGDKIMALVSGVGMLIPAALAIAPAFSKASVSATLFGASATTSSAAAATAVTGVGTAATAAGGAMSLAMWQVTLIVAAIAAVVGIIAFLVTQESAAEKALGNARKASEELEESLNEAKEAADGLRTSFEGYETAVEKLENCTKGTKEWKEALAEVNRTALEVIDNLPSDLSADEIRSLYNRDKGYIELDEEKIAEYQGRLDATVSAAEFANSFGKIEVSLAEAELQIEQFADELSIAGSDLSKELDNLTNLTNDEFKAALEKLGVDVSELSNETLDKYQKKVEELTTATDGANEKLKLIAQLQVDQQLGDKYDDATKEMTANMLASETKRIANELLDKYTGDGIAQNSQDDNEIYQEILKGLKEAGYDYDAWTQNEVRGTDSDRSFAFSDANGKEVIRTAEWVANTIAASKALQDLGQSAQKASEFLGKIEGKIGTTNADIMKGFVVDKNFLGATYADFSKFYSDVAGTYDSTNFSQSDVDWYMDKYLGGDGKDGNVSDETALKWGYDNHGEMSDAIYEAILAAKEAWEALEIDGLNHLNTLSIGTAQAIDNIYQNLNLGPLGAEAGEKFVEGLNKMTATLKPEDAEKALSQLSNIDWSSWDALDQARKVMKEFGVEIDTSSTYWVNFASKMRLASRSIPDFSEIKKNLAEVSKILGDLDFGSIIEEEDYDLLVAYNDEWERFFILQADGTRKFIGDAEEMKRETRENIEIQKQDLENRKKLQEGMDKDAWVIKSSDGSEEEVDWYKAGEQWTDLKGGAENLKNMSENSSTGQVLNLLGYTDKAIQEMINEYNAAVSSGDEEAIKASEERFKEMYTALGDFMNENLEVAGEDLDEMMASTATDLADLNQLYYEGSISAEAYGKQAQYLTYSNMAAAESLSALQTAWQQGYDYTGAELDYEVYADNLLRLAENYEICTEEASAFQNALKSGSEAAIKDAEEVLEASIMLGEAAEKYGMEVKELSIQSKALSKEYKINEKAAAQLAIENQRMNVGVANMVNNWEDWRKELVKSDHTSRDWAYAAAECTTAIADLVGASQDLELPESFFESAENMLLLEQAAKGSEEAISKLGIAVTRAQIEMMEFQDGMTDIDGNLINASEFNGWKNTVLSGIDDLQFALDNVSVGDNVYEKLGGDQWVSALNEMAIATNMSVEQMNSMLNSMGVQAEVTTTDVPQKIKVPVYTTTEDVTTSEKDGVTTYTKVSRTVQTGTEEMDGVVSVAQINTGDDVGSKPKITYIGNGNVSSSAKEGKTSPGDSGKKTTDADKTKKSDVVERYKEINDQLADVQREASRAEESLNRLYGDEQNAAIQDLIQAQEKEKQLLQEQQAMAHAYLAEDMLALETAAAKAGVLFTFDENGNIANYTSQMTKLYNELAWAEAAAGEEWTESEQEQIDAIKEKIEAVEEAQEAYESTLDTIKDVNTELDKFKGKPPLPVVTSDLVDVYKEVNDELDDIEDSIERIDKKADRLTGSAKVKYLRESAKIEKEKLATLQAQAEVNKKDIAETQAALLKRGADNGLTFTFDENGNISNYNEQLQILINNYKEVYAQLAADGEISDADQTILDAISADIDELEGLATAYSNAVEEGEEILKQQEEAFYAWQDKNFEALSYDLEIRIDVDEDKLELVDYYLSKMDGDVFSMGESLALMTGDKMNALLAQTATYQQQYLELQQAYQNGEISSEDYFSGLDKIKDGLMTTAQAMQELDQQTIEYYGNTLTAAQEEIDKYVESMDHLSSVLGHYQTILDLSTLEKGSEEYFKNMDTVLEGQLATAENAVEVAKATMDMFKSELVAKEAAYQQALQSGDAETIKIRQEQYEAALKAANAAEEEYLTRVEEYAQKTTEILEHNLEKLANTLEDKLTGGTSFDQMNTGMERMVSLHEEYLTTTNKVYETQKLMRSAQQEIDKTSNTVAKNKMRQFIKETQSLQDQNKLSKFELDIQQAKYDLLVAEIALEEAQNAKSQVRLQRDSEGNFGYVYTADQEMVQNAEQEFLDAQNELYNIGLEGANGYVQKYQQTMAEMYDTLTSLAQAYRDGEFESEAEYHAAVEEATQYYYEKLDQYSYLHYQAIQTDDRVATDYILSNSNLARTGIHGDTLSVGDSWRTAFLDISGFGEAAQMALTGQSWEIYDSNREDLENMTGNAESWKDAVVDYVGQVDTAFTQWKDNIAKNVSPAVEGLEGKVSAVVTASENFAEALTGDDGVIKQLEEEIKQVGLLTDEYIALRKSILDSISAAEQAIQTIMAEKVATVDPPDTTDPPDTPDPPATNPPTTNPTTTPTSPTTTDPGNTGSTQGDGTPQVGDVVTYVKDPYYYDSYGQRPLGMRGQGKQATITKLAPGNPYPIHLKSNDSAYGWVQKYQIAGYDTGGYTGDWNGPEGKFAMLHKKELVLNRGDTENFLASMEVLEKILSIIDLQSANQLCSREMSSPKFSSIESDVLEQNVSIEANFPNVSDRNEIEEAFKDLVNLASQYANRK